jgi:hypothetical protein
MTHSGHDPHHCAAPQYLPDSLIIFCGEPIEKRKQLLRQLLRGTGQKLSNVDYERVSPDR